MPAPMSLAVIAFGALLLIGHKPIGDLFANLFSGIGRSVGVSDEGELRLLRVRTGPILLGGLARPRSAERKATFVGTGAKVDLASILDSGPSRDTRSRGERFRRSCRDRPQWWSCRRMEIGQGESLGE